MLQRRLLAVGLILAMASFGFGVHWYLGTLKSRAVTAQGQAPGKSKPLFSLPGTVIVAQGGALYSFRNGSFTQIANGGWMQPAPAPGNQLVAVKRTGLFSDLYLMDSGGQVLAQLTHNQARSVQANHWAFFPRVSSDGGTLFYSWDPKDPYNNFRVDLAIFAMPLHGGRSVQWTRPNRYTGGDVQPVPLPSGGILYTKYDIDEKGHNVSQIWLTARPGLPGKALTDPEDACSSPALSRDGTKLAMICTSGGQTARLELAPFNGSALGPPTTLAEGMVASPGWSPDGQALLFFQAVGASGHFQLFYLNLAAPAFSPSARPSGKTLASASPSPSPTPPVPKQVTLDNDFDTTSPPVWI